MDTIKENKSAIITVAVLLVVLVGGYFLMKHGRPAKTGGPVVMSTSTPAEAEKLDLVRTIGSLSLVLRNEMDHTANTSSGARVNDLMSNHESTEAVKVDIPSRINDLDKVDPREKTVNKPAKAAIPDGNGKVEEIRGLNRSKNLESPN